MSPEAQPVEYDIERWHIAMEWLKMRAAIDLLQALKRAEPPLEEVEKHENWQYHYNRFKERALGFIKMYDAGVWDDPETVYFVTMMLFRVRDFTEKAIRYLRIREKPEVKALGTSDL